MHVIDIIFVRKRRGEPTARASSETRDSTWFFETRTAPKGLKQVHFSNECRNNEKERESERGIRL